MHHFSQRLLALAIAASLSVPALADEQRQSSAKNADASGEAKSGLWLNPMVITATRTQRLTEETLASISTISSQDLRRQQPREVTEALRGLPGVDVVGNGPFGKTTSVYLRGTSSSQNLLLIDGIRMGSATSGGAAYQFLPPWLIERIEIVRGARSSLYGADAIGGVVQMFTRHSEQPAAPFFSIGGGSFSTQEYGAGLSGREGATAYTLAANYTDTDGIALREGGERRGYDNTSALGRLSHDFANGARLGINILRSEGNTEFIGGDTDFVHQSAGAALDWAFTSDWNSELMLSESRDEAFTRQSFGDSQFDTARRAVNWKNTVSLQEHEIVAGLERLDDRVESTTEFAETSRSNTAGYVQALLDFSPFSSRLGVRHDDNEAFGGATTFSGDFGFRINDDHRLRAGYGEGFRAPTFNELYFPGFGNPELDAEDSQSVELGVSGFYRDWRWDAVAYHTEVDNLISTVSVDGSFSAENTASARMRGVELSVAGDWSEWQWQAMASYIQPKDLDTDKQLRRRARQSLRLELDRDFGRWSLGSSLVAQGKRYDDAGQSERLGGFGLLNLRASWRINDQWQLRANLKNALDKDYVTARNSFRDFDYLQPGRHVFVSLNFGG